MEIFIKTRPSLGNWKKIQNTSKDYCDHCTSNLFGSPDGTPYCPNPDYDHDTPNRYEEREQRRHDSSDGQHWITVWLRYDTVKHEYIVESLSCQQVKGTHETISNWDELMASTYEDGLGIFNDIFKALKF
jgi:uncharacterized Zn finger protein (UPF0148 family)